MDGLETDGLIQIEPVTPQEYEATGEIVLKAYRNLLGASLDEGYARYIADISARVDDSLVLILRKNNKVVGTVTFVGDSSSPMAEGLQDGEGMIRILAIDPTEQRSGYGRLLMTEVIRLAKERGLEALFLHSTQEMVQAHRLYRSLGFLRTPQRDYRPIETVSLLAFRLPLD
jgi:ribosomal protein S18 acetylase RimI-like enzyme